MSSSIRELARETRLSTWTVSMALSGKPGVAAQTREKVLEAAKRLDYHAHPLLSKALSLARLPEPSRYRETIAFLTEYPIETTTASYQRVTYESASKFACERGYKLEPFLVSGNPVEQRRLSRVLRARGVRALIVIPRLGLKQPRLHFEWEHFATVEIGRTLWMPRNLHHIETASYHNIIEAIHLLKKVGYHRIGMAVEPDQNKHQRGSYNAAYMAMALRLPAREQIPPISSYGTWNERVFRQWMKRYQPEVLIIHDAPAVCSWLHKMGLKVPEDISLFCSNIEGTFFTGLRRDFARMGRSAVEMLALLLDSGELGLFGRPRCWHIDEFWQTGETLSRSIASYISADGSLRPALCDGKKKAIPAG